jgi:hypothetical protein
MWSSITRRVVVPIAILLFAACQDGNADRIARLEARVAKLEQERTERTSTPDHHVPVPSPPAPVPAAALSNPVAEPVDTSVPTAPIEAEADATIQEHCTSKWPTDFEMQAYCKKQQREAVVKLQAAPPVDVSVQAFATLRRHCAQKWPTDFEMREYCERQQASGYRESSH